MPDEVTGFFHWASSHHRAHQRALARSEARWRGAESAAEAAEARLVADADRMRSEFRSTSVPLYGLPPSYECQRSIQQSRAVERMRWGRTVGELRTTRFGLTHNSSVRSSLVVDSVPGARVGDLEKNLTRVPMPWGHERRQNATGRTHRLKVDGDETEVRLLLPWDLDDPEYWACAIEVEGCCARSGGAIVSSL